MYFTSYEFIAFIAVLFFLYYLLPPKCQWPLLLISSYLFYYIAGSWHLVYILATTVTVFFCARRIDQKHRERKRYLKEHRSELSADEKKQYKLHIHKIQFRWLVACLVLNFGILAVVKYSGFFVSNLNGILNMSGSENTVSFATIALPMGISFYTLQAVGYLIDVYRETVPAEKNFFRLALFVSFFPLLVQGPISRYDDLSKTLYEEHPFQSRNVCLGLQRMLWGYFKKMIVADRILTGVSTMIGAPDTYQGAWSVVLMLFYTIELFADFTGGIDITIGIAQVMGIKVQENFDRPYFSCSLKEYWRRWHISMCSWFREYVFYPVSVCAPMQKLSKFTRKHLGNELGKRIPVHLSSFVVWFATGIWHGASWNFVVWGLANWLILMVSEELEPVYARFHGRFHVDGKRLYKLFCIARTFVLVCILNLFDCFESVKTTFFMFGSVFTARNWQVLWDGSLLEIGLSAVDYAVLAAAAGVMLCVSLCQRNGSVRAMVARKAYPVRFLVWFGLFLAVLLAGAYGIGYDASQFIYNRF